MFSCSSSATKRTSTVANTVIVIVNLLLPSYRWSVADLISHVVMKMGI